MASCDRRDCHIGPAERELCPIVSPSCARHARRARSRLQTNANSLRTTRMKPFVRPLNAQRMKGAVANAIASSVLLVFASCGIPKLQHAQPGAPLPDTFNGAITPESSAQVGIDEFFRDPLLATLIREGLVGNQQLRIMGQDIQVANYEILRRRGAFLPFISFGAGARLDKFSSFTKEGASIRDDPFRDS